MESYLRANLPIHVLRAMTPQERLELAFCLTDVWRAALKVRIAERYPDLPDTERSRLYRYYLGMDDREKRG